MSNCVDIDLDKSLIVQIYELQQENQQLKIQASAREEVANKYKEVIEELREYINSKVISNGEIIDQLRKIEVKELLQILDKAKGE